jgi:hypothetical protein
MKSVLRCLSVFLFSFAMLVGFAVVGHAQSADGGPMFGRPRDREIPPKNVRDMLYRMESEKIKKEYDELLDRGQQAAALTEQLESSAGSAGALSSGDVKKLADLEKLIKKIRDGLGGDDDDADPAVLNAEKRAGTAANIKYLNESAEDLLQELKRSTRFSISVNAIECSNSMLRTIRLLRSLKSD